MSTRMCFALAAFLLAQSALLVFVFSRCGEYLFPTYRLISKSLIGIQAALASIVPFALWDIALVILVLIALVALVWRIVRKKRLMPWLSVVMLVCCAGGFVFTAGWALNHYDAPLAEQIGLEVHESSVEELADATEYYLEQACAQTGSVPRDEQGNLVKQNFDDLAVLAGLSYEPLGQRYALYSGASTAPVKALLLAGDPLLYSGYVGIFFSPTGESCVSPNCADADIPFVMCHEAAHRLGIAGEQEANFSAYLACAQSQDPRFTYAGSYAAFTYCLNALAASSPERAQSVLEKAAQSDSRDGFILLRKDMIATNEHYKGYESSFETVGDTVNDGYLKSFGEQDGVTSYGLVVDYLIAWHERG